MDPFAISLLKGQAVDFMTFGKEMKVADTVADIGKKLGNPVTQGCYPGNISL